MKKNNIELSTEVLTQIFDSKAASQILKSVSNYRAMGLYLSIASMDQESEKVLFIIEQRNLINGYILSNKQLQERGREILSHESKFKVHINPIVFEPPYHEVTPKWIEDKMQDLGITRQDLIKQLALDKSSISLILSGDRGMSKSFQAAVYYYFLQFEINREFRQHLDIESNKVKHNIAWLYFVLGGGKVQTFKINWKYSYLPNPGDPFEYKLLEILLDNPQIPKEWELKKWKVHDVHYGSLSGFRFGHIITLAPDTNLENRKPNLSNTSF